jgi:hypothetical protein
MTCYAKTACRTLLYRSLCELCSHEIPLNLFVLRSISSYIGDESATKSKVVFREKKLPSAHAFQKLTQELTSVRIEGLRVAVTGMWSVSFANLFHPLIGRICVIEREMIRFFRRTVRKRHFLTLHQSDSTRQNHVDIFKT